jgi:hypothetical protein
MSALSFMDSTDGKNARLVAVVLDYWVRAQDDLDREADPDSIRSAILWMNRAEVLLESARSADLSIAAGAKVALVWSILEDSLVCLQAEDER